MLLFYFNNFLTRSRKNLQNSENTSATSRPNSSIKKDPLLHLDIASISDIGSISRDPILTRIYKKRTGNASTIKNSPNSSIRYILLLYCPPTSYSAFVISPSEQDFTVSINSAKRLPLFTATCCKFASAVLLLASLRFLNALSAEI